MSYLIVLPSIHGPTTAGCLAGMAPQLKPNLLHIDNAGGTNLGVAASWNVGARMVVEERRDWLIVLSAATRFGPEGGRDFVAALDRHADHWVVESAAPVGWHLLAWSRDLLEAVGIFDENFFPAYGEDADMSWRIHVAQGEGWGAKWSKVAVDAWITMRGHGTRLTGIKPDMARIWDYHLAKWGGPSGHQRFARPFDDPALPLSFWPKVPDPRALVWSS